jgi:poly(hydroxyalkanoate) granule-associated protein
MVKKVKGNADSQLSQSVRESAHLIWLAGLGAFAKVGEEGGKLFDTLIKEGEKVEERAREAASGKLEEAREMADETRGKVADTWDKVEQIFEDRLARVLGQLGVPNHDDLQELIQRVDALQQHIDELRKAREGRDS